MSEGHPAITAITAAKSTVAASTAERLGLGACRCGGTTGPAVATAEEAHGGVVATATGSALASDCDGRGAGHRRVAPGTTGTTAKTITASTAVPAGRGNGATQANSRTAITAITAATQDAAVPAVPAVPAVHARVVVVARTTIAAIARRPPHAHARGAILTGVTAGASGAGAATDASGETESKERILRVE